MVETNAIFVTCLPEHTQVEDLWKEFSCDESCKVDHVLFPLERDKSKAYIHFTEHPGSLLQRDHKVLGEEVHVEVAPWPAFSKCTAEVDPMVIASIPDVSECIAALKDNFHISAEYSPETGKFVMECSFEQLACAQVLLQDILQQQLEIQKRQLRRLSSRASQHHDPGRHGRVTDHGHGWHYPVTHRDPQYHGVAAAASSHLHQSLSPEDEDPDSKWLYSSDPRVSANATCGHASAPCSHMPVCPNCQQNQHMRAQHHHHHPAYLTYPPRYNPAAVPAGAMPAAVERSDAVNSGQAFTDGGGRGKSLSTAEESPVSDTSASSVTCDLDYYVMEYVMKTQIHRVRDIEQEFGVTVKSINRVCDEIVTVAFQRYNPTIPPENEEKAHRAFLALYGTVYRCIVQRTVQAKMKPSMTAASFLSVINNVCKERVFVSAKPDDVFVLVGPFEQVAQLENFILKENADHNLDHSHAHDCGKFHQDDESEEFQKEIGGDGYAEGEAQDPVSVFKVGGRLTVKVYSADITHLSVDVIVNAANEHLQNYAGVAGAIERAGGDELKEDCRAVVEQDGPLKVAEVVHTPCRGQLRCHYVVHTVGPVWSVASDKSRCRLLLQRTFENVLDYSHRLLHAATIALPAIGTGIFGVPRDVCAQSMYCAIKEVADKVSNLSLCEIHVVNIDPETTQFIQSVFLQLTSADSAGSPMSENPPLKLSSVVAEAQRPSPGSDKSPSGVRVNDEVQEEVLDLPQNVQTSAVESPSDERNTADEEVAEDHGDLQVAAQDPHTYPIPHDEKILDQEQIGGEETAVEQRQHLLSDIPDTVESQEQKSPANIQFPLDQDDEKSYKLPDNDEVLSTADMDSQTLDVEIDDHEQKNLADSQPLMDHEDQESTNKVPCTEVVNNEEKDNQSSDVKDSETGEVTGHEEHHHHLSSNLEPQLEMFMQEFNLEEYREDAPRSLRHELTLQVPADLPEDTSETPGNSGPWSVEPSGQENSHGDREPFHSLPVDTAHQAGHQ